MSVLSLPPSATRDLAELKRAELQMALGFITAPGIERVARVTDATVKLWVDGGKIKMFSPGTSAAWCTVAAFAAFVATGETFPGVGIARAKKKKAKKK